MMEYVSVGSFTPLYKNKQKGEINIAMETTYNMILKTNLLNL